MEASGIQHPFDTGFPEAEKLINDISDHPHFFVLGCVMDRRIASGRAWAAPYCVGKDLGGFDLAIFRGASPERVKAIFQKCSATGKSLHRFADKMADCFFLAVKKIADDYDGDASRIWTKKPKSALVIRRFLEFNGVGPKIAAMATNILVRDFKVPMSDLSAIDIAADSQVMKYFIAHGLLREGAKKEELIYLARDRNIQVFSMSPGRTDGSFEIDCISSVLGRSLIWLGRPTSISSIPCFCSTPKSSRPAQLGFTN